MAEKEIVEWTAIELSNSIHRRDVSCREVMDAYLRQIDRLNPAVNAIVNRQPEELLLSQADEKDRQLASNRATTGWMHGFPQAPKDLTDTAGMVTTSGSPLFVNHVPQNDSILIERVRASGAVLIGKTNVPEFGLGSHTFNEVFGATKNAYDQTKSAGGSSGGAGVSLALNMLPVADGGDFMGSLRNPAAWNNVYGFRPSTGRIPLGPGKDFFTQQFAYEGPMAKNVADLAMFLSVIAGYDGRTPLSLLEGPKVFASKLDREFKGARVGWLGNYNGYLAMEPEVLDVSTTALQHFRDIGCSVENAIPNFDMSRLWEVLLTVRSTLVSGALQELYTDPDKRALLKPEAVYEVELGRSKSALDFYRASEIRSEWYTAVNNLLSEFDFLVLPSAQLFPFDIESRWPQAIDGRKMDTYHRWLEGAIGPTLAGLPSLSVPAGFSAGGLPMGIQIVGKRNEDFTVLQMGHAYEKASSYGLRKSPLLGR